MLHGFQEAKIQDKMNQIYDTAAPKGHNVDFFMTAGRTLHIHYLKGQFRPLEKGFCEKYMNTC